MRRSVVSHSVVSIAVCKGANLFVVAFIAGHPSPCLHSILLTPTRLGWTHRLSLAQRQPKPCSPRPCRWTSRAAVVPWEGGLSQSSRTGSEAAQESRRDTRDTRSEERR